ncbi:MAG: NADH-quinone oxidoreductase subunit C [Eggerthellales bacterium]|nr:NADH-quinone oxidoreductase subunit C [Eggerthellales bacterium]
MAMIHEMNVIALADLPALSDAKKAAGSRFVQLHAVTVDDNVFDIVYSWMEDNVMKNYKIENVTPEMTVPSITNNFLAAFVFENEAHDLFGINIEGIAIDFKGHFYNMSVTTPMAVISPAQKEARQKAAKIAAAKAAKEGKGAAAPADDLEAKLAGMDPEKAAKVRAAMEAKAKKAAAAAQKEGE